MAHDPELARLLNEASERQSSDGASDQRRFRALEATARLEALTNRAKTHRIAVRIAHLLGQHDVVPEVTLRLSDQAVRGTGEEDTENVEVSGWVLATSETHYSQRRRPTAVIARWLLLQPDGRLTVASIDSHTSNIPRSSAIAFACDDLDDDPRVDAITWNEPFGDPSEELIAPAAHEPWASDRPVFRDESDEPFRGYHRYNAAGIESRIQQALGDVAVRHLPSFDGQ